VLCYNSKTMAISLEEVRHIAFLARLELTPDEQRRFAQQLSAVLEYASRLIEIDTDQIPPTASVLPLQASLREDAVRPSPSRDRMLSNAPAAERGMFRVPPVLE
jgi:aspartyl-tRNA(Asn)/glutamyl-tRNA(Gln) amidotransferase subunit C